ncbi:MAG: hypothetical protein M3P18_10310 [Actinomycetota bacterium]|nr:hypothetical protein [Actinomycetota bacterium]
MAGDLSSIPGLKAKHLAVLTGPMQLTDAAALAGADRRDVYKAMHRLRPRPTLEQISTWQDHARDLAAADPSAAEDLPSQKPATEPVGESAPVRTDPEASAPPSRPRSRPSITVDDVRLILAEGLETPLESAPTGGVPVPPGARLHVRLNGPAKHPIEVALRLRRAGRPSLTLHRRETLAGESAELDLDNVPDGEHEAVIAAWARDGAAAPQVYRLGVLRRDGDA